MKELDWKILIVLYEKRSITKTAEALYLTQSAVTKRLQNMENEWGIEVIRRSSQGVAFTEDGTYLAQRASVMLDFLRENGPAARKAIAARLGLPPAQTAALLHRMAAEGRLVLTGKRYALPADSPD